MDIKILSFCRALQISLKLGCLALVSKLFLQHPLHFSHLHLCTTTSNFPSYSWCSMCSGIILGNRYYCITCAEGTYVEGKEPPCDFCSTCRHEHDTEHPWHVLIKMKAFNHNRHSRPLSERINDLRFRPIASPPSIAVPVSPTEGRSDSSGDNKYYESDLDIPRSKKASDRDAISKRVRFSINAFRLSSSSAPSSAKEHDDSFQSGFRRQRRVSSTASGTPGLGLLGILHSGRSNTPNSTNSITAVDHSELNAGEGKVKSSTKANQLQRQCVSCNSEVNLELENYWSCIICCTIFSVLFECKIDMPHSRSTYRHICRRVLRM